MRQFLAAVVGSVIFISSAVAANTTRMEDLGACLAFSYINNDLDGKREVPAQLLSGILVIKEEFMFEASLNGFDDNRAQTFIVEQLTEQNRIKELKGIEAVREKYLSLCISVAESLASKKL